MKKSILLLSFLCVSMLCKAQTDTPPMLIRTNDKKMATKLVQFLVNYPDAVWEGTLSDTVKVNLVLNADGTPSEVKVIKDIGEGCVEEVKKVLITMLPPWTSDYLSSAPRNVEMNIVFNKETAQTYATEAMKKTMNEYIISAFSEEVYTDVDQAPSYGYVKNADYRYILEKMKYPAYARENNVQGKVITSFIVEKDGRLSDFKTVQAIGGGCEEEIIRILKEMPNWFPGKLNQVPVRVRVNFPVTFKLAN
jgi:TonB family protein